MKDIKLASSVLLLVSFLGIASSPAFSNEVAAISLLNRMNQALHSLSYKGTLVHAKNGSPITTLKITHKVINGVETETVVQARDASGKVSREFKGFSLASKIDSTMKRVYSFDIGRTKRVANLPCVIVTARPKDRARYLQKYCIDTNTGMLLDYSLIGKTHKPVEQFMFSRINIAPPNNASMGFSARKRVNKKTHHLTLPNLDDGWVIDALPKGFDISRAPDKHSNVNNIKAVAKHYVISDGLSSLSVFVSPFSKTVPGPSLKINSGALNVLTQRKHNSVITVVGEVPETTLKTVINNIHKK